MLRLPQSEASDQGTFNLDRAQFEFHKVVQAELYVKSISISALQVCFCMPFRDMGQFQDQNKVRTFHSHKILVPFSLNFGPNQPSRSYIGSIFERPLSQTRQSKPKLMKSELGQSRMLDRCLGGVTIVIAICTCYILAIQLCHQAQDCEHHYRTQYMILYFYMI